MCRSINNLKSVFTLGVDRVAERKRKIKFSDEFQALTDEV